MTWRYLGNDSYISTNCNTLRLYFYRGYNILFTYSNGRKRFVLYRSNIDKQRARIILEDTVRLNEDD